MVNFLKKEDILMDIKTENEVIEVSEEAVAEFLAFLEDENEYLDTGLGAFHTDGHSNW